MECEGNGRQGAETSSFEAIEFYKPAITFLQETHLERVDTMLFERSRFLYQIHAVYSAYSWDISVLVSRSVRLSCKESFTDPEGDYIVLWCSLNDKNFMLVNVYVPPSYNDEVLKNVFRKMSQWLNLPTLVMEDFKNIMNEMEDRHITTKSKHRMKRTRFSGHLQEMGSIDTWRIRYLLRREYSCCSSTYGSLSSIDLALGNNNFLP